MADFVWLRDRLTDRQTDRQTDRHIYQEEKFKTTCNNQEKRRNRKQERSETLKPPSRLSNPPHPFSLPSPPLSLSGPLMVPSPGSRLRSLPKSNHLLPVTRPNFYLNFTWNFTQDFFFHAILYKTKRLKWWIIKL